MLTRCKKVTKSSAVAVIADRTAYGVRYAGKLSNQFQLQVYEQLTDRQTDRQTTTSCQGSIG